jgi:F-type H+-transporting ATPase subunit delta
MANVSIARRYARALLDVGAEADKLDLFSEQLAAFTTALQGSAELADLMVNPAFGRAQRLAVVEAVVNAGGGFDPEVQNFLRLLVDRNRLMLLPDISRLFRDQVDAKLGRVRGRVTSAVPLPRESAARLAQLLAQITQRKVVLETKVDPYLLGGVSAQVGSVLYDGSLRTQLEELRRTLRTGP